MPPSTAPAPLSILADVSADRSHCTLTLSFPDNLAFGMLCGPEDRHLAHLEAQTGLLVAARGNRLTLSGEAVRCRGVEKALEAVYRRIVGGSQIGPGDIDDALRLEPLISRPDDPDGDPDLDDQAFEGFLTPRRRIAPRSFNQARYMRALERRTLTFGIGPAGSGKTYLAVAAAVAAFAAGDVQRLIFSRPALEAGERLGALPGDMKEKIDPYLRPLYDALYAMAPAARVKRALENGDIEIVPLAFMRGRTFSNAFAILDEAQNCTAMQLKMFLTRLGPDSRMAITGDPSQTDLPASEPSGLIEAVERLGQIPDIAVMRLKNEDIVRHGLVVKIVAAYENDRRNLS